VPAESQVDTVAGFRVGRSAATVSCSRDHAAKGGDPGGVGGGLRAASGTTRDTASAWLGREPATRLTETIPCCCGSVRTGDHQALRPGHEARSMEDRETWPAVTYGPVGT
jgi:hypothetical protein